MSCDFVGSQFEPDSILGVLSLDPLFAGVPGAGSKPARQLQAAGASSRALGVARFLPRGGHAQLAQKRMCILFGPIRFQLFCFCGWLAAQGKTKDPPLCGCTPVK